MARIYIDSHTARIKRKDLYTVTLTLRDGTVIDDLEPRRLFPVSNTEQYITLLDKNEREVGFVRDFSELDEASEEALRQCFAEFYRIPKIERVLESVEEFGSLTWRVMTDLGEVSFRIRNRHSDIKLLRDGRVLVRDASDNRYEIPDWGKLDKRSRHLLFSYI